MKLVRKEALKLIEAASANDDMKTATKLYLENSISPKSFDEAWKNGKKLKRIINEQKQRK